MDGKIRGALTVASGLGALITGYLWGYGVGEREGQDSDPEPRPEFAYENETYSGVSGTTPHTVHVKAWRNGG